MVANASLGPNSKPSNSTANGCSVIGTGVNHSGIETCAAIATSALPASTMPALRRMVMAMPGASTARTAALRFSALRFMIFPRAHSALTCLVLGPEAVDSQARSPAPRLPAHVAGGEHATPPQLPQAAAQPPKSVKQSTTSGSAQLIRRISDDHPSHPQHSRAACGIANSCPMPGLEPGGPVLSDRASGGKNLLLGIDNSS